MRQIRQTSSCRAWRSPGAIPRKRLRASAFSLIELLIVMTIVLVMAFLYWQTNIPGGRDRKRSGCEVNLQKVYLAMQLYAADNGTKYPAQPGAKHSEDPLGRLIPRYTSDTRVFICPATSLSAPALDRPLSKSRISYAYYMGFGRSEELSRDPLLSDAQVNAELKPAGAVVFSTTGKPPGNNHGNKGGNLLFSDGSVEWLRVMPAGSEATNRSIVLLNPNT
jgi:prepilin-type N-terminal cleavage/methylation domain-containing protein/prepilin-type processing-associated H-X9-DG protein